MLPVFTLKDFREELKMTVLRIAIALMLACLPVRADDMEFDVDIDTVLVCDTSKQVEHFVELFSGDVEVALRSVNAEQKDPTACDIATVAYVPENDVATVIGPCGHFRVVEILVVGVFTEDAGFLFTVPTHYFTMQPANKNVSRLHGRSDLELRKRVNVMAPLADCSF
jgi:hypothetical protein